MSSSLLKAFNNHLTELIDDVILVFPDNLNLKTGKTFVEGIQKVNPRSVIQGWKNGIAIPYKIQIENGDKDFFISKSYDQDLPNYTKTLSIIEEIKKLVNNTSKTNQEKVMKYVQNLTKLCNMYFS